jgi:hypothetical protein
MTSEYERYPRMPYEWTDLVALRMSYFSLRLEVPSDPGSGNKTEALLEWRELVVGG